MDPVTLIISALATGAAASLKETAGTVVKDAYSGFKPLLQRKFAAQPDAQLILSKYEQKPEVWKGPLEEEIKQSGLAKDEELLAAAQTIARATQTSAGGREIPYSDRRQCTGFGPGRSSAGDDELWVAA